MILFAGLLILAWCALSQAEVDISQICSTVSLGDILPHPEDCTAYIVCDHISYVQHCPSGRHYSAKHSVCDWPQYAECQLEFSIPDPSPDEQMHMAFDVITEELIDPMIDFDPDNILCRHFGAYFLPHPESCKSYYLCAYGHIHHLKCGRDTMWNFKKQQCEISYRAECFAKTSQEAQAVMELTNKCEAPTTGTTSSDGWTTSDFHPTGSGHTASNTATTTDMGSTTIYSSSTSTTYFPSTSTTLYSPSTATTFSSDTSTTYSPDTSTLYSPSTATTYSPDTSTLYSPSTATTYSPGTSTLYSPSTATTFLPGTSTTYSPDTSTLYSPSTATTYSTGTSTMYSPTTSTISSYETPESTLDSNSTDDSSSPVLTGSAGSSDAATPTAATSPRKPKKTTVAVPKPEPSKAPNSANASLVKCSDNDQSYIAHPYDCNKYFICIMGRPVMTSCPQGLYWDPQKISCDFPQNVQCFH